MCEEKIQYGIVREIMRGAIDGITSHFEYEIENLKSTITSLRNRNEILEEQLNRANAEIDSLMKAKEAVKTEKKESRKKERKPKLIAVNDTENAQAKAADAAQVKLG